MAVALEHTPDDPRLHYQQAELLVEHEEWVPSLASIERTEALAPGHHPTRRLRAHIALASGQATEACMLLDSLLAEQPGDLAARRLRARARLAVGLRAAASSDYRRVWRDSATPDNELACEIADVFASDAPVEALEVLDRGLRLLGPVPSLLLRALALDLKLGRHDSALLRVQALRSLSPRPEPWMARRAEILAQAGRAAESRAAWQALAAHLATLPNLERGTPAMSQLAERARTALAQPGPATFTSLPR